MKLVWGNLRKDVDTVLRLKRYLHNDKPDVSFVWAGRVYLSVLPDQGWVGQVHRTGESKAFETKAEAMAWVEVIVRMEGQ